jgi:hypothetical protein
MVETWGGEALLNLTKPNFYNDFLGILHIGNGASCAFALGGIILSLLGAKYVSMAGRKKALFVIVAVILFFSASYLARNFWAISKGGSSPAWIFYITATAIAVYGIIFWLTESGKASWFNLIKPAGTATLTCYCLPYVMYGFANITGIVLPDRLTHGFMSIINCLCFAFLIIVTAWLLGKLNIKLKI